MCISPGGDDGGDMQTTTTTTEETEVHIETRSETVSGGDEFSTSSSSCAWCSSSSSFRDHLTASRYSVAAQPREVTKRIPRTPRTNQSQSEQEPEENFSAHNSDS